MKLALLLTIILPIVLSKPTVNLDLDLELNREGATFDDVLGRVQDDLASVAKSKVALLNVLASSAVNTASDVGTRTAEVGASAVASVNVDNLESAINATEDVIKANKVAMIETVFDAKRKLLHGIQSIPGQINGVFSTDVSSNVTGSVDGSAVVNINVITNPIVGFINQTIESLNNAITATQNGLTVSKTLVADAAAAISVENAQTAVTTAIESTSNVIQTTGQALIQALVSTKEELADSLNSFDSQATIHDGKVNLGMAINASLQGAENYAEQAGVFQAIDNLVHSIANVPVKINTLLAIDAAAEAADPEGKADADEEARPKRDYSFEDGELVVDLEESEDIEIELPVREFTEEELEEMLEDDNDEDSVEAANIIEEVFTF